VKNLNVVGSGQIVLRVEKEVEEEEE